MDISTIISDLMKKKIDRIRHLIKLTRIPINLMIIYKILNKNFKILKIKIHNLIFKIK